MRALVLCTILVSLVGCTKVVTVKETKFIKVPIPRVRYEKFEKPSDIDHKVNAKGQALFEKDEYVELSKALLEYSEQIDILESTIDNYNEYVDKYNEADADE